MAKLIDFPIGIHEGETRLDIDPDKVLTAAVGKLNDVVIVGYEADGSFYFASTGAHGPDVLWLLKQAEQRLLAIEREMRT
jgi:uncharacterized ParB-like nuclease family protein